MSKKQNNDQSKPIKKEDSKPHVNGTAKEYEFNMFLQWMSLPANLRGLPDDQLLKFGVDANDLPLLKIKTMSQFADQFDVAIETLSRWKKRDSFNDQMFQEVNNRIFQKYYARVAEAYTMKTIQHADAARFEKWIQTFVNNDNGDLKIETTISGNGLDELTAEEIANMVSMRIKRSRGIEMDIAEDVEHEEVLPSKQEYDFEKISKIHQDKPVEIEPQNDGSISDEARKKLKAAIAKAAKSKTNGNGGKKK